MIFSHKEKMAIAIYKEPVIKKIINEILNMFKRK